MASLPDGDRKKVQAVLSGMKAPVRLVFFTQTIGCETCPPTRQMLRELVSLSDQLTLEELNLVLDVEQVREYGVDRVPAIAVVGAEDTGIRFIGMPAGYELVSLIDAIQLVSSGESGLSEESRALVAAVDAPLAIQVFVTPT